ncbi:hypothetical protein ACM25O_13255 [Sulfitobacter pontiacus]
MTTTTKPKKPYRRATPTELAERKKRIAALLKKGLTPNKFAPQLGVCRNTVQEMINNDPALKALHNDLRKTPVLLPGPGRSPPPCGRKPRSSRSGCATTRRTAQPCRSS